MRYVTYKSAKEWRPGKLLITTKEISLDYWISSKLRGSLYDGRHIDPNTPAMVLKVIETHYTGMPTKAKILLLIEGEIFVLHASDGSYGIPFEPIEKRIRLHDTKKR